MTPSERLAAGITAQLLENGRAIDVLSSVFTVVAATCLIAGWLAVPWWGAIVILAVGLIEKYVAIRVAFDAALFETCAAQETTAAAFDEAMLALRLLPASKSGRSWTVRCIAARRLLWLQAMLLGAQGIAFIALGFRSN